jgi:hypothetical protein
LAGFGTSPNLDYRNDSGHGPDCGFPNQALGTLVPVAMLPGSSGNVLGLASTLLDINYGVPGLRARVLRGPAFERVLNEPCLATTVWGLGKTHRGPQASHGWRPMPRRPRQSSGQYGRPYQGPWRPRESNTRSRLHTKGPRRRTP